MLSIEIQAGGAPQNLPLRSRVVLGAANGLPEGALELEPRGDVAVAHCRAAAQVGSNAIPAGGRRVIRAGESIRIGTAAVSLVSVADDAPQTKLLAQAMLRGAAMPVRPGVPSLLWLNGPELGKRVMLTEEATFVGRGDGCVARVNDGQASRTHAKLVRTPEGFVVFDLMSANGVLVDGERIESARPLRGGEVIQIGNTEIAFEKPTAPHQPKGSKQPAPAAGLVAKAAAAPTASPVASPEGPTRPPAKFARFEIALIAIAGAAVLVGGAVIAWSLC